MPSIPNREEIRALLCLEGAPLWPTRQVTPFSEGSSADPHGKFEPRCRTGSKVRAGAHVRELRSPANGAQGRSVVRFSMSAATAM